MVPVVGATADCDGVAGPESVADGAVGETAVSPPQAMKSSDNATTTNLGSFMRPLQCRFRSGANQPFTSRDGSY